MDQIIRNKKSVVGICLLGVFLVYPFQAYALPSFDWHGFLETAYGVKISNDETKKKHYNLFEQRFQLKTTYFVEGENYFSQKSTVFNFKADGVVDGYFDGHSTGDIREMNLSLTPFSLMDVKAGRQILTWGTGDYLFINDMFPKDYVSFFLGRHDEYLKKPSDALKMSFYPQAFNLDVIVMKFEPNTHAQGDQLSFFDSFEGGIAGDESLRYLIEPSSKVSNSEIALRLYRQFGSLEAALYYFHGFDKSPRSYHNEIKKELYYEKLDVYGASIRTPFAGGISNIEIGYISSSQDPDGDNRLIQNSMLKAMTGYSKDLGNDLSVGVQYYYEQTLDYGAYKRNLLPQDFSWDQQRHVLTQRITKLFKQQTVTCSLFNFYSPSDQDGYLRLNTGYDMNDQWNITTGINIPWGEEEKTEFGQMERNKNIYLRVRYTF